MKTILITGAAGFIGYHLVAALVVDPVRIVGIDSINDYYSPQLKLDRLKQLGVDVIGNMNEENVSHRFSNFSFYQMNISDASSVELLFEANQFDYVINLAAQAGVRYSLSHPEKYVQANVVGFFNLLDQAKKHNISHFVYSSSSSVYGLNEKMPLAVEDNVDHPVSLYAATKKSNELFAHAYSHLYDLPTTGLRFFTVYGPWGRPDMAYFKFTRAILKEEPIDVYNHGDMVRDFTYIDDIVEGIRQTLLHIPQGNKNWNGLQPDPSSSPAPFRIFNIGNHTPIQLIDFISLLERHLGKKAKINFLPLQPGDVYKTFADVSHLINEVGYQPNTSLDVGIERFVKWFLKYTNK